MGDRKTTNQQLIRELAEARQRIAELEIQTAERERVEEALRSANEILRIYARLAESSPDLISVVDRQYLYRMVNPSYARFHGKPAAEIAGHPVAEIHRPEEYRNSIQPNLDRCFAGESVHYEAWFTYAAAWQRYMDVRYYPLYRNGQVEYAVVLIRDITDRKVAEEERERVLAELDATISSMPDGVNVYDPKGTIVRMNPAAEEILGYSARERKLPPVERVKLLHLETPEGKPLPPEDAPAVRALRGERLRGVTLVVHTPDGRTCWLSNSAAPIRTLNGKLLGAVVVFSDVTQLHQLQEQQEDLVRAVSHDLRAPITVIQGQAQILGRILTGAGGDGRARRSIGAIITSVRRMNAMIQDLVDSVRMESRQLRLQKQPVDLKDFLSDLLQRSETVMDVGRVRDEIPEDLPPAKADPNRLERILGNLLSNALKYSLPETEVTVSAERADGELKISVTDRGVGIAPEDIPHIFERFYKPKGGRKAGGLGLGLYITRMLVGAHGGRIWVESDVGKGSTFSFTLPDA